MCARAKDMAKLGAGVNLYLNLQVGASVRVRTGTPARVCDPQAQPRSGVPPQCYLLVLFTILSLLAVPSFLLANGGHKISEEDMDPLGLGRFTLGNNGALLHLSAFVAGRVRSQSRPVVRQPPAGEAEVATAGNTTVINTNTTYVSLAGRQLKAVDVSRLLTAMDFLGCLVFMCFMLFFKWRISRLSHALEDHTISVGDYAVFVKGA